MAKRTIADLNIKLSAGTATLQSDFAKAGGLAKQFGGNIMSIAAKIGGALAGAFAVSSIASGVRGQMRQIDEIAKTADQIGASVADVQALNMAADLAGVGVNELAGGFRKMAGTAADAANGSQTAAASLARVGLSVQDLAGKSPVEQLAAVIDALQGIGDATERMALAQDLLGKGGQAFLSLDSSQIRAAAEDVDRLGLAMTRADAAKVEEANDAMTRMTASVQGLYQELAIALAPAITDMATRIANLVGWIGNFDATTVVTGVKVLAFTAAIGTVLMILPKLVAGIRLVSGALRAMTFAQVVATAMSGPAGWAKLAGGFAFAAGSLALVAKTFADIDASAAKTAVSVDRVGKSMRTVAAQGIAEFKPWGKSMDQWSNEAMAMERSLRTAAETADAELARIQAMYGLGLLSAEMFARGRIKIEQDYQNAIAPKGEPKFMGRTKSDWERLAASTTEAMLTPAQKLQREMQDLQVLLANKMIDGDTFNRARSQMVEQYQAALRAQEKIVALQKERGVGAVQAGTTAAFSAIQASGREYRDMVRGQHAALAQHRLANQHLAAIAQAIKPPAVQPAVIN